MIRPLDRGLESRLGGQAQPGSPGRGLVAIRPKADVLCSLGALAFMTPGGPATKMAVTRRRPDPLNKMDIAFRCRGLGRGTARRDLSCVPSEGG
jgi:hypothetical protein